MTSLHLPRSWMQTVQFLIFILQMSEHYIIVIYFLVLTSKYFWTYFVNNILFHSNTLLKTDPNIFFTRTDN